MDRLRRREFIIVLGGAAAWSFAAHAQLLSMPKIGFLYSGSPETFGDRLAAFAQGLKENGYVGGQNTSIEYRWARGKYDLLPELAADLVHQHVDVIAACGSSAPGLAAKAITQTIPIVFQTGADPVADGLVASMNRPGGNVTGVARMVVDTMTKSLELLRRVIPNTTTIAFLVNPLNPVASATRHSLQDIQTAAHPLGIGKVEVVPASSEREFEPAIETAAKLKVDALLIDTDSFFNSHTEQLAALTVRHALPALYSTREFAAAGGLISYGASLPEQYRQVGVYVSRILAGAKPADLPVLQPTKFDLVINLKTARTLGLEIPPTVLALADEVIE